MTSLQYQAGLGRRLKHYGDSESRGPAVADPRASHESASVTTRTLPRRRSIPGWARAEELEQHVQRDDDGSVGTALSSIVPYPVLRSDASVVSNVTLSSVPSELVVRSLDADASYLDQYVLTRSRWQVVW